MDIKSVQELIDSTAYWDEEILDLKFSSFGDDIDLVIRKSESHAWQIRFSRCIKVVYTTDAEWRGDMAVSDMTEAQKGYFGQRIDVSQADAPDAYRVYINLSILEYDYHLLWNRCKRN